MAQHDRRQRVRAMIYTNAHINECVCALCAYMLVLMLLYNQQTKSPHLNF